MGERKGTKGLELWCRKMTEGYPGVKIDNMTTSWRDGLAFCAIIHHFRPDLIDFTKLNKDDVYHNNELAFRVAEQYLGIPALLEPEDMVEYSVPDRLSILTYLSQFYQAFAVPQGKSARITVKRSQTSPDHGIVSPASSSPPSKVAFTGTGRARREPCAKCSLPVFIAERLNVGKNLYHRTCFRCARCNSQLTLANYYETENGDFCCELCPDEEKISAKSSPDKSVLSRSMSDEEKTASLKTFSNEPDDYSSMFETALESIRDDSAKRENNSSEFFKARSQFIQSQVEDEKPPDLPKSKPPQLEKSELAEEATKPKDSNSDSGFPDNKLDSVSVTVTKDKPAAEGDTSLVKARMRLFENKSPSSDVSAFRKSDVNRNSRQTTVPLRSPETPTRDKSVAEKPPITIVKLEELENFEISKQDDKTTTEDNIERSNNISNKHSDVEDSDTNISLRVSDEEKSESVAEKEIVEEKPLEEPTVVETPDEAPQLATKEIEEKTPTKDEEYPDDLNPFGDEDEVMEKKPGASLNPFGDDEDEEETEQVKKPVPSPRCRKKLLPTENEKQVPGANPFESDEDDSGKPPVPATRKKKVITAPQINLNPFWSEDEDNEEGEAKPVPKPRTSMSKSTLDVPEPKPRDTRSLSVTGSNFGGSNSSISSGSFYGSVRKKKPAPRPPLSSNASSLTSSPCQSVQHSPRSTPKYRKIKKAPPPPPNSSTPVPSRKDELLTPIAIVSPIKSEAEPDEKENEKIPYITEQELEQDKIVKDEANRNRQSQNVLQSPTSGPTSSENSSSLSAPNKSTYGKWKRRKGLAPNRPIPQKRTITCLPVSEIRRELDLIEIQQQGLEKQGVRLEEIIREKCESNDPDSNTDDGGVPIEVEDLMLQLFELVNEKNELFRKQTELMYLRRQQRLEEEHADVEYQIRCLMLQPEANKTDSDKAKEEELINRLVEIVERRNEIIECLEMDRVREAEEDDSITNHINLYTLKRDGEKSEPVKKDKKKHKREKKSKHKGKVDIDKDIDESEPCSTLEKKKKKKFNIF